MSIDAVVLSRHLRDFRQAPGLRVENWLDGSAPWKRAAFTDPALFWMTLASSVLRTLTSGAGYVCGDSAGPGLETVNVAGASQHFMRLEITQ